MLWRRMIGVSTVLQTTVWPKKGNTFFDDLIFARNHNILSPFSNRTLQLCWITLTFHFVSQIMCVCIHHTIHLSSSHVNRILCVFACHFSPNQIIKRWLYLAIYLGQFKKHDGQVEKLTNFVLILIWLGKLHNHQQLSLSLIHLSKVASVNRLSTRLSAATNELYLFLTVDDDFSANTDKWRTKLYSCVTFWRYLSLLPTLQIVCLPFTISLSCSFLLRPFAFMSASPEYFLCRLLLLLSAWDFCSYLFRRLSHRHF